MSTRGDDGVSRIKTALDLALEKVRDLQVSPEDLARMKHEQRLRTLREAVNRFLAAEQGTRDLAPWAGAGAGSAELLEERIECAELLLGKLSGGPELARIEFGLRSLGFAAAADRLKELPAPPRAGEERLDQVMDRLGEELLRQLAAEGIDGSAVVPNLALHPGYDAARRQSEQNSQQQLDAWRSELRECLRTS
jgi:hypothetical protein